MITGKEERPRIVTALPGSCGKEIIAGDERHLATTTKASPAVVKQARGIVFEDVDGNVFFDFTSGIGVTNTGHCHPEVVRAIQEQAEKVLHFAGTDFYYDTQVNLGRRLAEITPGCFDKKTYFGNSGAEAVEAAIKLARWSTNRKFMLAFMGAFHGRTMGALSLTASKVVQKQRFFPWMPGAVHAPFPNPYRNVFGIDGYEEPDELTNRVIGYIEEMFKKYVPADEVAAIFVEAVQGEGGYIVPPASFLPALRKLADEHHILLVDDEIQAGFGRTGKMFAIEHFDVIPDVITLSKAIASGIPIGATVFDAKYDFGVKGAHSTTFGGNPVACAASLATIDVLQKEKLVENAARQGQLMHRRLKEMEEAYECVGDARGLGLMQATEFVKSKEGKEPAPKLRNQVMENALKRGLLLLSCGESGIRYIPPLTITAEQVNVGMDIMEESIREAC
ncbi:MAG: acetyl ornithine aminotransferase family protein [Candidatus Thermoplasmatota archaeon]|nr:acetyl ornithine aminotransferase family protein [Candidatus Thermoplasmatota archaeon]